MGVYYKLGALSLLDTLGLTKQAADPTMGQGAYTPLASANHESGKLGPRNLQNPSSQVRSSFLANDMHNATDVADSVDVYPAHYKVADARKHLHKKVTKESPVKILEHELAQHTGGGFYAPKGDKERNLEEPFIGVLTSDQNPYILAHEIGHAQFDKSLPGKLTQNSFSRNLTIAAPFLAGIIGGSRRLSYDKRLPIALTSIALANEPTLISEGAATYKGHKLLDQLEATPEQKAEYWKEILPAQSTYLLNPFLSSAYAAYRHKTSAHKLHGRRSFRNLQISIENRKNSIRKWYDPHAKREGRTIMKYPYGYIRMSEGMDGDHVDCFIGPNEQAEFVYVITTNKPPKFTEVDEQKCMLGFDNQKQAVRAFHLHYDDPRFLRSVKAVPYTAFERKVLATRNSPNKKIAFIDKLINTGPGPHHDSVPGDYLGLPSSSLIGMPSMAGDSQTPETKIDRQFRFHDLDQDTHIMEGNTSATPSGPLT